MAVQEITAIQPYTSANRVQLFKRLPDKLLAPLGSLNRQQYWSLLSFLHEKRFGPDAPLPPSNGFTKRELLADIEDALTMQDSWESDESTPAESNNDSLANTVFLRLLDCGWFRQEKVGVEFFYSMKPVVIQFLTLLVNFAETGPVFLSGKIRSIDASIQLVISGQGSGDSLSEAAEQSRNLIEHVRTTGTNIKDLMDSLSPEMATAYYVKRFFADYIEKMFIGDYRELKTHEHPLSKKGMILQRIDEIYNSEEQRLRLIGWYEAKQCPGNRRKAESLFERDIARLMEIRRIDDYLDRLDSEIHKANKRALVFLDYRIRSLRPVDHLIKKSIQAVIENDGQTMDDPFAPGDMISPMLLAEPKIPIERAKPLPMRKSTPSPYEIAKTNLLRRSKANRSVTPNSVSSFVGSNLKDKDEIPSDEISINTVSDLCAYQRLLKISLEMDSGHPGTISKGLTHSKGFRVRKSSLEELPHQYISGASFNVVRFNHKDKK